MFVFMFNFLLSKNISCLINKILNYSIIVRPTTRKNKVSRLLELSDYKKNEFSHDF